MRTVTRSFIINEGEVDQMKITDPDFRHADAYCNANSAGGDSASMPSSKVPLEIARVITEEASVDGYTVELLPRNTLHITLKW